MTIDPDRSLRPAAPEDLEAVTDLKAQVMRADPERLGRRDPARTAPSAAPESAPKSPSGHGG
ncbi:hypothetical protein ACFVUY_16590 [Kitasatospora sp. NPDC058063]|uniref:hypothetical protein n=1 Tax=unclassified Kitasatospora TaxID=2633591 RepID=UPI0036DCF777